MSPTAVYLALGASAALDAAGVALLVWWTAAGRQRAAEALARADEQSQQIRQQARRDAESLKEEASLEAREKTRALVAEAEQQARHRRQEIDGLDQSLADR